jgi:hypothetical protein
LLRNTQNTYRAGQIGFKSIYIASSMERVKYTQGHDPDTIFVDMWGVGVFCHDSFFLALILEFTANVKTITFTFAG